MKHELWTDKPTDNIVEISPDFSSTLRWKRDVVAIVVSLSDSRKNQGLTQDELAERIGVSQPVIARFEKMGRIPTIEFLYKVASGLGVELMPLMPSNAIGSPEDVEDDFPSSVFSKAQQNVYQIVAELTALRVKQRISQVELAKRIKTTQSVITRFERMGRVPTIEFLYKVADGLGVELKPLRISKSRYCQSISVPDIEANPSSRSWVDCFTDKTVCSKDLKTQVVTLQETGRDISYDSPATQLYQFQMKIIKVTATKNVIYEKDTDCEVVDNTLRENHKSFFVDPMAA